MFDHYNPSVYNLSRYLYANEILLNIWYLNNDISKTLLLALMALRILFYPYSINTNFKNSQTHCIYSERLYISDYKQNLTNNIMDPFLRYIVITVSPWIGNENVESIFWTRSAFSYFSLNANSLFRLVVDTMVEPYINIIDMYDHLYYALKNICSFLVYYTN